MQSAFVYCRNTAQNWSCFLLSGCQDQDCCGEKLNVSTGYLHISTDIYRYLHILQISTDIHRYLHISTEIYRYLQTFRDIYRYLQISTDICRLKTLISQFKMPKMLDLTHEIIYSSIQFKLFLRLLSSKE